MSLQATEPPRKPTASPPAKRLGAKVKAVIDRMVWEGMLWQAAAAQVGMSLSHMRIALEQPHVKAYLSQQRQVFRESASTRADFRLIELSEQNKNMAAAVSATQSLRGEPDQQVSAGVHRQSPGVTIIIEAPAATQMRAESVRVIEHEPDK